MKECQVKKVCIVAKVQEVNANKQIEIKANLFCPEKGQNN